MEVIPDGAQRVSMALSAAAQGRAMDSASIAAAAKVKIRFCNFMTLPPLSGPVHWKALCGADSPFLSPIPVLLPGLNPDHHSVFLPVPDCLRLCSRLSSNLGLLPT